MIPPVHTPVQPSTRPKPRPLTHPRSDDQLSLVSRGSDLDRTPGHRPFVPILGCPESANAPARIAPFCREGYSTDGQVGDDDDKHSQDGDDDDDDDKDRVRSDLANQVDNDAPDDGAPESEPSNSDYSSTERERKAAEDRKARFQAQLHNLPPSSPPKASDTSDSDSPSSTQTPTRIAKQRGPNTAKPSPRLPADIKGKGPAVSDTDDTARLAPAVKGKGKASAIADGDSEPDLTLISDAEVENWKKRPGPISREGLELVQRFKDGILHRAGELDQHLGKGRREIIWLRGWQRNLLARTTKRTCTGRGITLPLRSLHPAYSKFFEGLVEDDDEGQAARFQPIQQWFDEQGHTVFLG
ncbi:hypothetical protein BJ138DRAFT_1197252 [Hygrophoropsis aurantiaca]|uniref:Uncharacterized protein n=1 Tax=Hygrophoropsis aurantiaca TaxID=72124 RepID=A0ACB7ZQS2_9AGAM|nr:hypothetical protein BJ138DRAFT_1197252 [Hygrophoropsis aurantiaca]